jgi:hypothetical protein
MPRMGRSRHRADLTRSRHRESRRRAAKLESPCALAWTREGGGRGYSLALRPLRLDLTPLEAPRMASIAENCLR